MHYVYFLATEKEDWHYVGSTSDRRKRVKQHNNGKVRSTKTKRPLRLRYYEAYGKIETAREREQEIKNSRYKKQRIIDRLNK